MVSAANVGPLKQSDESERAAKTTPAKKLSLCAAAESEPAWV